MASKLVIGGAWVQVLVQIDGVMKSVGLATGCSYDESFQVQPANVLNYLGPITYDSQGYSCSISISTFVPELENNLYADGGQITIKDLLPTRDQIQLDGKGKQFDSLVFANRATGEVLHQFSDVIIDSDGEQVSPNAYVTANLRLLAVKRVV
jgi:hypothetical protein